MMHVSVSCRQLPLLALLFCTGSLPAAAPRIFCKALRAITSHGESRAYSTLRRAPTVQASHFMATPTRQHTTLATKNPATIHLTREAVKDAIGRDLFCALQHTAFMRKLTALGKRPCCTGMSALEFVAKFNFALAQLAHWGNELSIPIGERISICRNLAQDTPAAAEIDTVLRIIYPKSKINSITLTEEHILTAIPHHCFAKESGLLESLAGKEAEVSDIILIVDAAVSGMVQKLRNQHKVTVASEYIPFQLPPDFNTEGKKSIIRALLQHKPTMLEEAEAAMIGYFEGRP